MSKRGCCGSGRRETYCDVIIERWQKLTGKQAVLESGETFDAKKSKEIWARIGRLKMLIAFEKGRLPADYRVIAGYRNEMIMLYEILCPTEPEELQMHKGKDHRLERAGVSG